MKTISWFGTTASIIGSFVVAMQILTIGYSLFICGSLSWFVVGIKRKDTALITMNGVFFLANLLGLYNAIR